jgi:predicted nuclease of predicted toxin-antitoxin system
VLAAARAQSRILLTFDLDVGQLVFERRFGATPGVILLREVPPTLADMVQRIVALLDRQDLTFEGHFTVITADRIRQRPLPEAQRRT